MMTDNRSSPTANPAPAPSAAPGAPTPNQPKSVSEQLKEASGLLKGTGLLLAALPPLAVITGLVSIPPTLGQLVKLVTVPISIVVVLIIFILGESISRLSPLRSVLIFGSLVVAGAAASVAYFAFAGSHIVSGVDGPVVVPLQPSTQITEIVAPYDWDWEEALEHSADNERLAELMRQESASAVVLMVLLMVLAQVLMVAGMVGALWNIVVSQGAARRALAVAGARTAG